MLSEGLIDLIDRNPNYEVSAGDRQPPIAESKTALSARAAECRCCTTNQTSCSSKRKTLAVLFFGLDANERLRLSTVEPQVSTERFPFERGVTLVHGPRGPRSSQAVQNVMGRGAIEGQGSSGTPRKTIGILPRHRTFE